MDKRRERAMRPFVSMIEQRDLLAEEEKIRQASIKAMKKEGEMIWNVKKSKKGYEAKIEEMNKNYYVMSFSYGN